MRRYELMLLLRPDLEDDKLQSAVEKVTRAIVNGGGSLSKVSPWGKRRLAYDIQNFREASYFLIQFDIEPSAVREIERGMLISEEILRHLVTLLEERPGGSAEDMPETEAFGTESQPTPAADAPAAESPTVPAPANEDVVTDEPEPEAPAAEEPEPAEAEPATSGS
jgi:small subunit ribosomal protein S6